MDLPSVWAGVRTAIPDARLAIIGDGPPSITRALKAELTRHGVAESVDLLGFLDDETKTAVLGSAELLLFPSYYESWGIVALEALCQSRPVVAYDLPVYDSLFNAGMVRCPVGDSNALAQAVANLALDPERLRALGCAGREAVSKLRWADSATQIADEVRMAVGH
jgi:glycosyltransferase involved in cell wall biosynthesis